MLTNIVALTAGLAATTSAFTCNGNYFSFFNRGGAALSYQRLDPGLFPGTESPHLHSFDGGNALSASTDYEQTQTSSCSTARIKPDNSLYWRPTLFWNGNGTGFYRVPEQSTKIYYKFGDGDKWANVTGFPEDFNMIAGKPTKRSDGENPAGVRWGCHQPDGRDEKIFDNGFPKGFQTCTYGFASEVTFPSCWNGKKLDPKDPNAHMAYPTGAVGVGTENCPTTHRAARFPTIFIEFWYDISSFKGQYPSNSVPWVLSNGDTTGYGFHGDFLNGWDKGVLEKATAQTGGCNCGCGCGQTEMEQCFGSANVNKDGDVAWESCSVMNVFGIESAPVLATLPGCNPLQGGPADATIVSGPNCAATAAPTSAGSKTSAVSSAAVTPSAKAPSSVEAGASSSSKVVKDDTPSLSLSLPNKQVSDVYGSTSVQGFAAPTSVALSKQYGTPSGAKDSAKPTPSALSKQYNDGSSGGKVPAGSTGEPSSNKPSDSAGSPSGDMSEGCKASTYITVTPTIYVTAGVNSTSCGLGTVTKTITQTATITASAQGGFEYGSY